MRRAIAARVGLLFWLGICSDPTRLAAAPVKLNGQLAFDNDVETSFRLSADGSHVLYVADQEALSYYCAAQSSDSAIYRADADIDEVFELYAANLNGATFPPGDYNHNGVVDAADVDGNNKIDVADYNMWKSNFGRTSGSGASSDSIAAVPEPPSNAFLCVGSSLLIALFFRYDIISAANRKRFGGESSERHVAPTHGNRHGNRRNVGRDGLCQPV
jgi:hypothetical protein